MADEVEIVELASELTRLGYAKTSEVATAVATATAGKVDKVTGKELSTNDYNNTDKDRVNNLQAVAFSNSFADLLNKPFIPATAGDVGAATTAQGAKAEAALPTTTYTAGMALKVDKVNGYGLSKNDLTDSRAAKLDAMPDDHFKGIHVSEAALTTARPTAIAGDYADVDAGVGVNAIRYVWDVSDAKWVPGGASGSYTAAQILALYEANPNRNAFTDALKTKLDGVAANATANPNTDSLAESGTPTNQWFTAARVRAVVATGLSLADAAAAVATDSFLVIVGKLQRQINDITTSLSNKVDKVGGKDLSTNDYSNAAVAVVASVAAIGANATKGLKAALAVSLSDESTALTTGTKLTIHVLEPMTVTEFFGGLSTPQTSGTQLTFDVKKNGTSIFSTKPVFNAAGETTIAATTPGALTGTVALAKGDKLTFSIDAVGDGTAKGLKVYLLGTR